jgi:hypothetical protein
MLFGDADDITSDEDEQEAPAAESPASRHGSGDERDSDKERSQDQDEEDENRTSLPVIEDVSIYETVCSVPIEVRWMSQDSCISKVTVGWMT